MHMILRTLEHTIKEKIDRGKAIVIVGARQVGKTTLIKEILKEKEYLFLDAEDPATRSLLQNPTTEQIRGILGNYRYTFLDEAQRIPGIGMTLKIITDQFKDVQLLVSGSSSFDLGNELNEPLMGRKWEYELFPISWDEYENSIGLVKSEQQIENRVLYGFYPEVINDPGNEIDVLKNLTNSYLYRDILAFSDIRKPEILEKLVQALALQIGSEVNYNELSQLIGINKLTIQKYIEILEKRFVVFRLSSFSRNIRNEIKKSRKIYFYDNGIRNMHISNFNQLDLRADKGALWENFLVAERRKQHVYKNTLTKMYFWRTKQQQEIDLIEEFNGQLTGFEFKWGTQEVRFPKTFMNSYDAESRVVNRNNFREFITIKNF